MESSAPSDQAFDQGAEATPLPAASGMLQQLEAERGATSSEEHQALFTHEVAHILAQLGELEGALQNYFAANDIVPSFAEAAASALGLAETRMPERLHEVVARLSDKELPPALEAQISLYGALIALVKEDYAQMTLALERAARSNLTDPALWLLYECLAVRSGDRAVLARALNMQAEQASDPTWRALLDLQQGELAASNSDYEQARMHFERAAEADTKAKWLATLALGKLGSDTAQPELLLRALDAQAEIVLRSLDDPSLDVGLPFLARRREARSLAQVQAALLHSASGRSEEALRLLEQVLNYEGHPAVRWLALAEAELLSRRSQDPSGAHVKLRALAQQWIEAARLQVEKALGYLVVARSHLAEGNLEEAAAAAERAFASDRSSMAAEALMLELQHRRGDLPKLVAYYEEDEAHHDPSRLRLALFYAVANDDLEKTRHLFSKLVSEHPTLEVLHGVEGALLFGKPAEWSASLESVAQASVSSGADPQGEGDSSGGLPTDQALGFEELRKRFKKGAPLRPAPGTPPTEALVSAYQLPTPETDLEAQVLALRELAYAEDDVDRRQGYLLAAAVRAHLGGNSKLALESLSETEAISSGALSSLFSARLLDNQGDLGRAARVLTKLAQETPDDEFAATLHLCAGLYHFHENALKASLGALQAAEEISAPSAQALSRFVRRMVAEIDPDAATTRAGLQEVAERGLEALERFALEAAKPDGATRAAHAVDDLAHGHTLELEPAAMLAGAMLAQAYELPFPEQAARFDALEDLGEGSRIIARSAAYYAKASGRSGIDLGLAEAAELWVQCDGGVLPALEWLVSAQKLGDHPTEALACRTLAARLEGRSRSAFESRALLLDRLLDLNTFSEATSTDPSCRLARLELRGPGSEPKERAEALLSARDLFGAECQELMTALSGYNLLAIEDYEGAEGAFRYCIEANPNEVFAWEGLRAVAEATSKRELLAEAYLGLGEAVVDDAQGALYLEKAAFIFFDDLLQESLGEQALRRAVERDASRTRAFDKWFRIVRDRKDHLALLSLVESRLQVTDESSELVRLFWERARAHRQLGQLPEALTAISSVELLEPQHIGALALSAEIHISQGQFRQAAEKLGELARLDKAPLEQRLMSGIAAVDLYENKLADMESALKVMLALYQAKLTTLPVRERLARAAAKAGAWEPALNVLTDLSKERTTSTGRAEAARLALAISRDEIGSKTRAFESASRLLEEMPGDIEAIAQVAEQAKDNAFQEAGLILLRENLEPLLDRMREEPPDLQKVGLLAEVARVLEHAPLRQAALGALAALGKVESAFDLELQELDERVAKTPRMAMDPASIPDLVDPLDHGPLGPFMLEAMVPYAEALGPKLEAFGVNKKHRVDPRQGLFVRSEIAAWAGALQIGEFELYVGGEDPHLVRGIPADPPMLVIGTAVTSPLSPMHRQAVARELFALKRGTSLLRMHGAADVAALFSATLDVLGIPVEAPSYALRADFGRQLAKGLSRRARRSLLLLAEPARASLANPLSWVEAALASMDRVAALACGDVSWVVADAPVQRGKAPMTRQGQARLERLLGFALSPRYLVLREQLGLGVQ